MTQVKAPNVIKQLLTDMDTIEEFLARTQDHMDPRTMPGMQARQHEFMEKLETMSNKYREVMRQQGFAIFLAGDAQEQAAFAAVASEVITLNLSANAVYDYLAKELWPAVRAQDQFQATHIVMLIEHMVALGQKLGMNSMPNPAPTADLIQTIGDVTNLSRLIRLSIERQAGTELASEYLEYEATERALQNRYSGSSLLLLITDATTEQIQNFRRNLFQIPGGARNFVISIGKDQTGVAEFSIASVSEKTVGAALAAAAQKYGLKVRKDTPTKQKSVETANTKAIAETQAVADALKVGEGKIYSAAPLDQVVDKGEVNVVTSELTEPKK